MRAIGIITVEEFKKAVEVFGFESPVVTAIWNTMESNPSNADEFETVYALWATGKFDEGSRRWYAVQSDREDTDWGTGSHDLEEAKELLKQYPEGRIAVIENDLCVEEIEYSEVWG